MSDDLYRLLNTLVLPGEVWDERQGEHFLGKRALAEIERLTRERDEQKETAEYLLKLEQEWIDYNIQLSEDWKKEHARADAAERKVEKLREALRPFVDAYNHTIADEEDKWRDTDSLWESAAAMALEAGDLRRARAALAETEKGDE